MAGKKTERPANDLWQSSRPPGKSPTDQDFGFAFRLWVVVSGHKWALLVRRHDSPGVVASGYFWLKGLQGLPPTDAIRNSCGPDEVHELATPSPAELRVLELLKACAQAIRSGQAEPSRIPVHSVTAPSDDYDKSVRRLWATEDGRRPRNARSELRRLLVSWNVFSSRILEKPRGKNHLVLKAHDLAVVTPEQLFPRHDFVYLEHISTVLSDERCGRGTKQPPGLAKLRDGTILCRTSLEEALVTQLKTHPTVVLTGPMASGKTCLVRTLAHRLHGDTGKQVYFFDCAIEPGFDPARLAHEIIATQSLVIIENVHASPDAAARLHERLSSGPRGQTVAGEATRVLLTTRPSPRQQMQFLSSCPTVSLQDPCASDEVIRHMAVRSGVTERVGTTEAVRMACGGNLWLASYSIDGCRQSRGPGMPSRWIAEGVERELADMFALRPIEARAILSIAIICSRGGNVAHCYLVRKLAISPDTLDALVTRGDIVRNRPAHGTSGYSLPHATVATAYRKHGTPYMADFCFADSDGMLWDYITSKMPDSLNVALYTGWEDRLDDDLLISLLDAASDLSALVFLGNVAMLRPRVYAAVAAKLESREPASFISMARTLNRKHPLSIRGILREVNTRNVAEGFARELGCVSLLNKLAEDLPQVARAICDVLEPRMFASPHAQSGFFWTADAKAWPHLKLVDVRRINAIALADRTRSQVLAFRQFYEDNGRIPLGSGRMPDPANPANIVSAVWSVDPRALPKQWHERIEACTRQLVQRKMDPNEAGLIALPMITVMHALGSDCRAVLTASPNAMRMGQWCSTRWHWQYMDGVLASKAIDVGYAKEIVDNLVIERMAGDMNGSVDLDHLCALTLEQAVAVGEIDPQAAIQLLGLLKIQPLADGLSKWASTKTRVEKAARTFKAVAGLSQVVAEHLLHAIDKPALKASLASCLQ